MICLSVVIIHICMVFVSHVLFLVFENTTLPPQQLVGKIGNSQVGSNMPAMSEDFIHV